MKLECSIEGCDRPHNAKGLCTTHEARLKRNGTVELPERIKAPRPHCSLPDCDMPAKTRGMCGMHAERVRSGIDIAGPKRNCRGVDFMELVARDESGCWIWQGSISSTGYGRYGRDYAHRHSYKLHVGSIPDGLVIDHLCRVTACVNPAHLEPVSQQINVLRGVAPSALAVQLDRCHRGHRFTPANTYYRPDGAGRQCRKCIAIRRAQSKDGGSHAS